MMINVLEYLEKTASRCPHRVAYQAGEDAFTFAQLKESAVRIGSALAARAPRQSAVAVMMDPRGAACVRVFMGVWYAGCFYAPLDPALPPERLGLILENLRPRALVCDDAHRAKAELVCPAGCALIDWRQAAQAPANDARLAALRRAAAPDDLAAVLYTSGSTGVPKGVAHTQASFLAYTEATIEIYGFTEATVFGNQSPFFYANSIIDIFPPIALGARVCMIPASALAFPKTLVDFLRRAGVTELTMTPSSFVAVANAGVLSDGCLPDMRYLIMSGEAMPWRQLDMWMRAAPGGHAWNFYGSTEMFSVSVGKVRGRYAAGETIPVGRPFPVVSLRFVAEDGTEAPRGVPGEMYVSSPMVSRCYYRDEARSAQVYVPDPLGRDDRVFFRSGDYGYLNAEGELVVVGRRDSMVKHHGYRMELGEVEAALRAAPGCLEACCLLQRERDELWCFVAGDVAEQALRAHLRARLARYMLPDRWVIRAALPHTANMKIDRKALAALMD